MHWKGTERIAVSSKAYIYGAVLVLLIPLQWLLSAAAAAAFHELFHYLAVKLCRGEMKEIRIGQGGILMEVAPMGHGQEIICALAGPLGSFLLVGLIHLAPMIALCGVVQGLYNLIPCYPLDGGRAFRCALERWVPEKVGVIERWTQSIIMAMVLLAGCCGTFRFRLGILPLFCAVLLTIKVLSRKIPCKDG